MKYKPNKNELLRLAELLYDRIGPIDDMIEIIGDSMIPTFKPGSLAMISKMPYPDILMWSEYYYIVDTNGQGRVRRVYESNIQNCIKLVTDHPDQDKYPPISIGWNAIKAIYIVRAGIVKH